MNTQYTPGATRLAEIFIPEGINKRGHASTIATAWGKKTREGVADMIDRETHAPELLEALRRLSTRFPVSPVCGIDAEEWNAAEQARQAIAKATQGA